MNLVSVRDQGSFRSRDLKDEQEMGRKESPRQEEGTACAKLQRWIDVDGGPAFERVHRMGLGGQRLNPAARPRWQCWGPRAVVGATERGEDTVRGKRDCQWPARTGADDRA